jgi:hypothetical protein
MVRFRIKPLSMSISCSKHRRTTCPRFVSSRLAPAPSFLNQGRRGEPLILEMSRSYRDPLPCAPSGFAILPIGLGSETALWRAIQTSAARFKEHPHHRPHLSDIGRPALLLNPSVDPMESSATYKTPLWLPRDVPSTNVGRFINFVNQRHGLQLQSYADLHRWSVGEDTLPDFWRDAYIFLRLAPAGTGDVGKMLNFKASAPLSLLPYASPPLFSPPRLRFAASSNFPSTIEPPPL